MWHFLFRRLVLNAPETRTSAVGTPTSLWCFCCSGRSLCWTSSEREEITGAERHKGQGQRQHAPPVSEHPQAAQLCPKVSSFSLCTSYCLQKAFFKYYIMLLCCYLLNQTIFLSLTEPHIDEGGLGFVCASFGLRKCQTQLVVFFFFF